MYSLIVYDTSNFVDFPIGGQLTSIRNFLAYLANKQTKFCSRVLLVGVTNNEDEVCKLKKVLIDGVEFDFLPVLYRNNDLNDVKKSLRLEYLISLFKHKKYIPNSKNTIHYVHTPEAFIQIKAIHRKAKVVVFSHGSFFNMVDGFRFYKNNRLIAYVFNKFIVYLIKKSDLIFTLDKDSTKQYSKYTKRVKQVNNSVVLPFENNIKRNCKTPIRLLFVGRLSKVKRVDEIIKAVEILNEKAILTIVGDGEENNELKSLVEKNNLCKKVKFEGAVSPQDIGNYMKTNDILIMNSIFEGKPMTIIEAMSYGMPIITTPVGGITEMTEEHFDSEYTNGEKEQIVEKVLKISKEYTNYSNNAFHSSKKYDYCNVNKEIFDCLNSLMIDN